MPIEHPLIHIAGQVVNSVVADASSSRSRGFTLTDAHNFRRARSRIVKGDIVGHYVRLVEVARRSVTRVTKRERLTFGSFTGQSPFFFSTKPLAFFTTKFLCMVPSNDNQWLSAQFVWILKPGDAVILRLWFTNTANRRAEALAAVSLLANILFADFLWIGAVVSRNFNHVGGTRWANCRKDSRGACSGCQRLRYSGYPTRPSRCEAHAVDTAARKVANIYRRQDAKSESCDNNEPRFGRHTLCRARVDALARHSFFPQECRRCGARRLG